MKFRTKLTLLFAGIVFFSVGTITIYTHNNQKSNFIEAEQKAQANMVSLLTAAISSQYYSYLNEQINSVLNIRNLLRHQATSLIQPIDDDNDATLLENMKKARLALQRFDLDMMVLHDNKIVIMPTNRNLFNFRSVDNKPFLDKVSITSFNTPENFISVFNKETDENYVVLNIRVGKDRSYILSLCRNVTELANYYNNKELIASLLNESLIPLRDAIVGDASIIDATTYMTVLQSQSHTDPLDEATLKTFVKDSSINYLQTSINDIVYELQYTYYKPLDWFIVVKREQSAIISPANSAALIIVIIGLSVSVIAILLSLLISNRLTSGLREIARRADLISNANLSDINVIASITSDLATNGNDEIAKLTNAISTMGVSLSKNLKLILLANEQKQRVLGELKAAAEIQIGMLIKDEELPSAPEFTVSSYLTPAKEVGGDFYDAFMIDDEHITLVIGDVSDKGVPAALFMSMTMNLVRTCMSLKMSPQKTMQVINNVLAERNPNMMFVTLFISIINVKTGEIEASNAGHCLPIIISEHGVREFEEISGPAVGPIPDVKYSEYKETLQKGESILLYTDGVSEAQNSDLKFFGVNRILDLARENYSENAHIILQKLKDEVAAFRGKYIQTDDITILCFKRN